MKLRRSAIHLSQASRILAMFALLAVGMIFISDTALAAPSNPIVFVTQLPLGFDANNAAAAIGTHPAYASQTGRGGELWVLFPNGSLRSITSEAGYGTGTPSTAIAVREPSVSFDGKTVIFSMVIGPYGNWQIYEATNISADLTVKPTISKLPKQPSQYNNISPIYGSDGRVIFASDMPFNGNATLYPQLDEYEGQPTITGLLSLDRNSGDLRVLTSQPSGSYNPFLDSFGRVIFTNWDHLRRDALNSFNTDLGFKAFNFSGEGSDSVPTNDYSEHFPQFSIPEDPSSIGSKELSNVNFNHFLPWQVNQDGTGMETLNHIGRHELFSYFLPGFNASFDSNIKNMEASTPKFNQFPLIGDGLFSIREDPSSPGRYFGIAAKEFFNHKSGQLVSLLAPPNVKAGAMILTYVSHPETATPTTSPTSNHSGFYRDPLPLVGGGLIASHTFNTLSDKGISQGSTSSNFNFRLRSLKVGANGYYVPDQLLTGALPAKSFSFCVNSNSPCSQVSFSGQMWELSPVELVARTVPIVPANVIEAPEQQMFSEAAVDPTAFSNYLREHQLALVVSRNLTTRDGLDKQQPYNLRVAGTSTESIAVPGKIYDISHLQFFQGDYIRGYNNYAQGRRVLAQPLHDPNVIAEKILDNSPSAPEGAVKIASDGSMAALVPAKRPLSWQLTSPDGTAVVRERFWLNFAPGEIRVCASCHGITSKSQNGGDAPTNPPLALKQLLVSWKANQNGEVAPPPTPTVPPSEEAAPPPTPSLPPSDEGNPSPGDDSGGVVDAVPTKTEPPDPMTLSVSSKKGKIIIKAGLGSCGLVEVRAYSKASQSGQANKGIKLATFSSSKSKSINIHSSLALKKLFAATKSTLYVTAFCKQGIVASSSIKKSIKKTKLLK